MRMGWMIGFVMWLLITLIEQGMTTMQWLIHIHDVGFAEQFASEACLVIGLITLPIFVIPLIMLAQRAFSNK